MSRRPITEGRVACPREGRDVDFETCLVCPRLRRVEAGGVIECGDLGPGRGWLRAALASLFAA